MASEDERAVLRQAIVGDRFNLYYTSASFHALVHALTDQIIDYVDKAAVASEAEQERQAEAIRDALAAPIPALVFRMCQWERCPLPGSVYRDIERREVVVQRLFFCVLHSQVWDHPEPHAVSVTTTVGAGTVVSLR